MKKLVMISGCGHTGTTLLARMMGVHSEIYNPPFETNIFLAYNSLKWKYLIESLYKEARRKKKDYKVLLEKTPRHIWHIDFIRRKLPETKFILMTRNGKDVIASLYERYKDIQASIRRYKDDSLLTIRQIDDKKVFLLRYEDLIENPKKCLKEIMNFVELKFESDMLNFHQTKVSWFKLDEIKKKSRKDGVSHNNFRNWQVNQPLFKSPKTWKERIPKKNWIDLENFFEEEGNKIMNTLGYP
tara:strand:+ start:3268 stop:3993 length:726 start_codon:yes stop_codon:yes gene_type:complete